MNELIIEGNCEIGDEKDIVYRERNRCVALAASMAIKLGYNAGIARHTGEDKGDKNSVVYIDLPTGQISWHIRDCEKEIFSFLNEYIGSFDGHDTKEKYKRIEEYSKL